jgi:hypothetical protein
VLHFAIGITVITLMTVQLCLGWMIKLNLESKLGSSAIYPIKRLHSIIGFMLYFIGKINVLIGVSIYDSQYVYEFRPICQVST